MLLLLLSDAFADAIAPGPPICPPGFERAIQHHAEICAFDPLTAAIEGGVLLVLAGIAIGVALMVKKR